MDIAQVDLAMAAANRRTASGVAATAMSAANGKTARGLTTVAAANGRATSDNLAGAANGNETGGQMARSSSAGNVVLNQHNSVFNYRTTFYILFLTTTYYVRFFF